MSVNLPLMLPPNKLNLKKKEKLNCGQNFWHVNSLSILDEVSLDIATSKSGHQLNFAETIVEVVRLALKFLFEN